MFASNKEENRTGSCKMSEISTWTLDALLRFLYYGFVGIPMDQAPDVLEAAEQYYELLDPKGH
ncbi:hypothetical protein RvY_17640 [Ramazzottius varieornatus]|uniref:BTB domain-containing protein n=1 Tax=Ramazzottius varieornatus TaxID=947166 RepID=A0A1D1W8L0_RAMVA|nr:hypothetical protein RvY_17640 [Ramazzottius varieornatus]